VPTGDNPRSYLNSSSDNILSDVVNTTPFACDYHKMCSQYTPQQINDLIHIDLFRVENDMLLLDSTVIVHEDIQSIFDCLGTEISSLADKLCERNQKFMPVSVPLRMDLMKNKSVSLVVWSCI